MTPPSTATVSPRPPAPPAQALLRRGRRPWRGFAFAVILSLGVHLLLSLFPAEVSPAPEDKPLQLTITEIPPPPLPPPAEVAKVVPRPKPKRATPTLAALEPAPTVAAEEVPASTPLAEPAAPPEAAVETPPALPDVASVDSPPIEPELPAKDLPARLDLAYKVFLGTQGFLIGDATYRFEHTGLRYTITTVGQARGLAALIIHGQGKLESHGFITRSGLQPQEFSLERGGRDRREVATFDWETGIITLYEQKTAPLETSTYDPLALMWQYYFSPPTGNEVSFSIATTRRVFRYNITREPNEKITWSQGEIDTEVWHRRSEDGKTDSYVWLAPSLHYVPVKLRVVATERGTLEAVLDSIRVDEPLASR